MDAPLVAHAGFKLFTSLSQLPECWNYKHVPPHPDTNLYLQEGGHMCICMHTCTCPQKQEVLDPHGHGVTGGCEPPDMGTEN